MSREIKFRAWNTIVHRMLNFTLPAIENQAGNKIQWHILEIMQYTGLKDRNGKEIYEGDIVQTVDNHLSPGKYIIHWREDVYMMVGTGGPGEWLSMEEFEGCELIGNIHQNPELLKGGNSENNMC